MKLQNTVAHMAGTTVKANGNVYEVGPTGITDVDNENDAQRLLADRSTWRRYVERAPVVAKPDSEPAKVEIPKVVAKAPEKAPEPTTESDTGIDWPDPKPSMTVKQLHEIADAYQVEYTAKTTKSVLVETIMGAMYEDEE